MKTCCVVVVGHVDHGKTSLVHSITGMKTDRLPEEQARGLSITAGFAHKTFPQGVIDFIDAPGHEDFIQATVAGATGAQAVLLVISAIECMQAQTHEHLAIADLLGITEGVIAVTKSDLLSPTEAAIRLVDLRTALSGTRLANAPMILCSAKSGAGMGELDDALETLLSQSRRPSSPLAPMLPIDRVFSLAGRGTIVTGTLLGGGIEPDMEMVLQPQGQTVSLRALQSRGAERKSVHAGERVAVNLRNITVNEIARGDVLCIKNFNTPSYCIDVQINQLPTVSKPLKHMEAVRVLFGTAHEVATVRLFGGGAGGPYLAQLRFAKPVCGYEGQRAILRRLSPSETGGGALFLDTQVSPARAGDKLRQNLLDAVCVGTPSTIADALCRTAGGVAIIDDIARLSVLGSTQTRSALGSAFMVIAPNMIAPAQAIVSAKTTLLSLLGDYHDKFPLKLRAPRSGVILPLTSPILFQHVLQSLQQTGQIRLHPDGVALSGHDPIALLTADQRAQIAEIEATFRDAAISPIRPPESQPDGELRTLLIEMGRIIALQNVSLKQTLLFHHESLTMAADQLGRTFPPPQVFTTSQARDTLDTSRKIIVPVLEHFDKSGVTTRTGDARQMTGAIPVSPPAPSC